MTDLERAAQAIYMVAPIGARGWDDAPAETREDCFVCASAVIESILLDPSEEAVEAAAAIIDPPPWNEEIMAVSSAGYVEELVERKAMSIDTARAALRAAGMKMLG